MNCFGTTTPVSSTVLQAALVVVEAIGSSAREAATEVGALHEQPGDVVLNLCRLCSLSINGSGVVCGGCGKCFHQDVICLGGK